MNDKRLVAIGIKKKGEKRFKITTEVNLKSGKSTTKIPVDYSSKNGVVTLGYNVLIGNGSAVR